MKHLHNLTRAIPVLAALKGGSVTKDCTPAKENFGKCEDVSS
jgi:hypothetical protein